MKANILMFQAFISFYAKSKTLHKVHTPFIYELLTEMYDEEKHFYAFDEIEHLRQMHLSNQQNIELTDLGAGSRLKEGYSEKKIKTVSSITKSAAIPARQGQQLFRLCNMLGPSHILELGSSIGMASLYMSSASKKAQIITIEGDPEVAEIARQNFKALRKDHIESIVGNFDDTLTKVLEMMPSVDLALIDGNHTKEASLRYFYQILPHIHNDSVLIFDDINWSSGMQEAWHEIISNTAVRASISNFYKGYVFFRKEFKEPVHINFVPKSWKPWQLGFFQ